MFQKECDLEIECEGQLTGNYQVTGNIIHSRFSQASTLPLTNSLHAVHTVISTTVNCACAIDPKGKSLTVTLVNRLLHACVYVCSTDYAKVAVHFCWTSSISVWCTLHVWSSPLFSPFRRCVTGSFHCVFPCRLARWNNHNHYIASQCETKLSVKIDVHI